MPLPDPEKFTKVIFGQFSSTCLMSPIYVYWLCKCQPLLKKFSEYPHGKFWAPGADGTQLEERTFLEAAPTCDFVAIVEVHFRQLCALFKHLDVA